MILEIKKADLEKDAKILFELDKKAFNRPYDIPATSVEQVKKYLKGAEIYLL